MTTPAKRKNVLFIVSDDMRPQLNIYSGPDFPSRTHPTMHTPNLDGLARKSLLLKRAYVQVAVCSPSRTSLLTGRRPDTTHVYDLVTYFRKVGGNYTTIPEYFKQKGYLTAGMGKIFHPGMEASGMDDPISWTENYYHPDNSYWMPKYNHTWTAASDSEVEKHPLIDQMTAAYAIKTLNLVAPKAKSGEQNFFVAVGFHRPHLPFIFPEKYLQYYPESSIKLPANPYAPVNMPQVAWSWMDELRTYDDILDKYGYGEINSTLPADLVLALRRAYYASISYVDDLVGELLDELNKLGLASDTVVSFWGDHGWQLGEHGEWCKQTNFELATHAPMMVHIPGLTDKGVVSEQLTEFVDLFPTLVEAAGLYPIQLCPVGKETSTVTCTEGISMLPLVRNPTRPWKSAAFSQYIRMSTSGNQYMGYSMRTHNYRYTEWVEFRGYPQYAPKWRKIFHRDGVELYDHLEDPEENINRAFDTSYTDIRQILRTQLHAGWRNALPNEIIPSIY